MRYDYDLIIVGAGPAGIFTALNCCAKAPTPRPCGSC